MEILQFFGCEFDFHEVDAELVDIFCVTTPKKVVQLLFIGKAIDMHRAFWAIREVIIRGLVKNLPANLTREHDHLLLSTLDFIQ